MGNSQCVLWHAMSKSQSLPIGRKIDERPETRDLFSTFRWGPIFPLLHCQFGKRGIAFVAAQRFFGGDSTPNNVSLLPQFRSVLMWKARSTMIIDVNHSNI